MKHAKTAVAGCVLVQLFALASGVRADSSLSGRQSTGQRASVGCLCGVVEGGVTGRCFVDSFCGNATTCSSDSQCEDDEFCLNADNCCGVPKCVVGCGELTCNFEPGEGTCDNYELCYSTPDDGCSFNNANARGVKTSMVRDYAPCPGTEHPTANTETESGTDACAPVTPDEIDGQSTLYSFAPTGKCEVSTRSQVIPDCEQLRDESGVLLGLESGPCHVTSVKSKCTGIVGTDGLSPLGPGDAGWSLATLSRATFADDSGGDMTVIDFPVTFAYEHGATLEIDSNSAVELIPLVGVLNAELPTCTAIELVDMVIKDPLQRPFARPGGATVPQGSGGGGGGGDCDFDIAPARGLKATMVRSWAPCPGSEHPVTNTETEGGTAACNPVVPDEVGGSATPYNYGPKGSCVVQTGARLVSECSAMQDENGLTLGLPTGPCHVTFLKSNCKKVVDADDVLIGAASDGWTLATVSRATLADETGADMTVIDFPVSFLYSTPSGGSMQISSNSAVGLLPLVGVNGAALPVCTSIQFVDMTVEDPDGLPFAKLGGATIPR